MNDQRADEETGERPRFPSVILPTYAGRSPKVTEALPLEYLHGLSTKAFVPALAEYFDTEAGLSASTISRLTADWAAEAEALDPPPTSAHVAHPASGGGAQPNPPTSHHDVISLAFAM